MHAHLTEHRYFEFSFSRLDTVVEVETSSGGVVVRASRDSFSAERKEYFIRELAAEGFIGQHYRWHALNTAGDVQWIVDPSPFMPGAPCVAQTRRLMVRLLASAGAIWLLMMTCLFLNAPH